ncbi:hypothetical protein Tco_1507478 [Tanacetum coccineum]
MNLMNRVCKLYLDEFFIMIIDDNSIYSKSKEDHEVHLKLGMELLKEEKCLPNFRSLNFGNKKYISSGTWLTTVVFIRTLIAKPLTALTQKNQKYERGAKQEEAFQTLKDNLRNASIRSFPDGPDDFLVYYDMSIQGFCWELKGFYKFILLKGLNDENPPPPPPLQTPTQQAPHIVSTIKLPILEKGEYDIWAMKMEHYLSFTDYPIWEVIQKGNGHVSVSTDTNGVIKVLPPKTAEEILARERERKARTTLLMALPEDHLEKFHKMTDAKDMWDAIKSRFGGNDESKKMFQSLLSQLEIHGACVSTKDVNQKFLRVFESDVKGSTGSSSSTHNVAFVSFESTSSTNDVSTAYDVSTSSGYNSQRENSSSYTDELMYSFFANQSNGP